LLRAQSNNPEEDVVSFVDALIFNWLIAGTDAHAKNYSLLLGSGGAVRLAPLYDLASVLPYQKIDLQKAKLAMKIGGEYRLRSIGLRQWQKFAKELHLDEDQLIGRLRIMARAFPDHIAAIQMQMKSEGLTYVTINRLARRLTNRVVACQQILK
jgi:serine/threonine-protein kinase HipA